MLFFLLVFGVSIPASGGPAVAAGHVRTTDLSAGQIHSFPLIVSQGDFLHLEVEQQGIDVIVTLFDDGGHAVLEVDSPNSRLGIEPLYWIAKSSGRYRVQVRAFPQQQAGKVSLRLRARHPPTPEDRQRAQTFANFLAAESSRSRADPTSWRQLQTLYLHQAEFWLTHGEPLLAARCLRRAGGLAKAVGDYADARRSYLRALPLYRAHDGGFERVTLLLEAEEILRFLGESGLAREFIEEAMEVAEATQNHRGVAVALNDLGILNDFLGHPEVALELYREALDLWQDIENSSRDQASVLHNLGVAYSSMGRLEQGLGHLRQAEALRRRLQEQNALALTLGARAWVLLQRGNLEEASSACREALELQERHGSPQERTYTLELLGQILRARGEGAAAKEALAVALRLVRSGGNHLQEAILLHRLGQLAADTAAPGAWRHARRLQTKAYEAFVQLRSPRGQLDSLTALAAVERRLGNSEAARTHLDKALALVEQQRLQLWSDTSRRAFFANQRGVFDDLISLLFEAEQTHPGQGNAARALSISTQSQSRTLLDSLHRGHWRHRLPAEQRQQEQDLRDNLTLRHAHRLELAAAGRGEAVILEDKKLRQLEEQYRHLEREVRSSTNSISAMLPATSAEIQAQLDAETLLLVFHWGHDSVFLWQISTEEVILHRLAADAPAEQRLRRQVIHLLELLPVGHKPGRAVPLQVVATAVADALLAPVAGDLGTRRLLVVADGPLAGLPFTALPAPLAGPAANRPFLLEDHELVHLPSASLLEFLHRPRACQPIMELAIVADPVFRMDDHRNRNHPDTIPKGQATDLLRSSMEVNLTSLERLPNSGREARRLLELLPAGAPFFLATGFNAHRGTILDGSMATARRLHFATHGLPDNRHPELSALVLSRYDRQGQAIEALLRARDLAGLELCADLVVLSACRTALGHEIPGEGLVGLTQAFFLAGARRVVASYWSVNDAATAELMIRFYEGHLKKGMAPAAALRQAQLGILRETAWKAPSHWAAFALQGTWKR